MAISERKEKIVYAVVDSYIESCEPISSAGIRDRYLSDYSSATIRNELAALEEMGYLIQPHTSAGRIPTVAAYKLYVNKMLPRKTLSQRDVEIVHSYFNRRITEIEQVLRNTAKVISEITNLTGVAIVPSLATAVIEEIKLIKLSERTVLVVIPTNHGILKDDVTIETPNELDDEFFKEASKFITSSFRGRTLGNLIDPNTTLREVTNEYRQLFNAVMTIIREYVENSGEGEILLEGTARLLSQPEYANVKKARPMLEMLESKKKLAAMLKSNDNMPFCIKITGAEEIYDGFPECAVIKANYRINGVNIGSAGVIGPVRMDYSKIVAILDYIGKILTLLPSGEA